MNIKKNYSVDICLSAYNGEKYICEQIDSILSQSYFIDNITIIDDVSQDNTLNIINSYTFVNKNINLFKNNFNFGPILSFENALYKCQSDIIFFSDQDDVWYENKIADMIQQFDDPNVQCVVSNALVFYENNTTTHYFFPKNFKTFGSIANNLFKNRFIGCCMAFRRDLLRYALPFPRGISMHDWWIGSVALSRGNVVYLSSPLIKYRRHSSNTSQMHKQNLYKIFISRLYNLQALIILFKRLFNEYNK